MKFDDEQTKGEVPEVTISYNVVLKQCERNPD